MAERPACPSCAAAVDRFQHSRGVVAAYPCRCWTAPEVARRIRDEWRERHTDG